MLQRGDEVVIRMLENVQQVTNNPLIERVISKGTLIRSCESDSCNRLVERGYENKTVRHGAGEFARDNDGDRFCEVHVNTLEEFWSLLRSWLRPRCGIPRENLPLDLSFFEFVHNARSRSERVWGIFVGQLLVPHRNST